MISIALLEALIALACINASTDVFITLDPINDLEYTLIASHKDIYSDKHESLLTCYTFDIYPEEYILFPNKTILVPSLNRTYEENLYIHFNDHLRICNPFEFIEDYLALASKANLSLKYLVQVGLGVSMVFLFIHIVVFVLVPDMKNLPGWNLASLCFSLFLSYFVMLGTDNVYVRETAGFCIASAVLVQFFFLASFLWMCIISFDIFRSMRTALDNLRVTNKQFKIKKYVINSLISWGVALVFTVAAIIADNMEGINESIKPNFKLYCWYKTKSSLLTFFCAPVFGIIGLDFILFGFTAYKIFSNKSKLKTQQMIKKRSLIKKNCLMYFKLATIMGAPWITALLAVSFDRLWLWFLFTALNSFQGFFIFITFTCTKKVRKYLKLKLLKNEERQQ
ncbi:g-protein coupled receptor Mth2 [Nephila pilipes]|uniref:G-protein coupled receptor Mth2 n=1 Tax=Nephila pilipes TaxID=299642 RepID=A0A8X6TPA2_NEPPI|nr:g-protein coupled receptor Mth2 [Nephila pilipes]